MGAIPPVTTTRGLRSSAFDLHQSQMKKQLLPKDLAARAQKVDPAKVEAEVLRIISAKPAAPPAPGAMLPWDQLGQMFQAGGLQQAQATRQEMDRQARMLERLYMADIQQTPFMPGSLGGGFTG
jgi:hypothetical protein